MRSSSSSTEVADGGASIFSTPKWPSSRRTHSLSSSSSSSSTSSSSYSLGPRSLPPSPATPLCRYTGGIPFSWESLPGIPKNSQILLKNVNSPRNHTHLPLPPPAAAANQKNYNNATRRAGGRDPFFAALVECSKGGGDDGDADKDVSGSIWRGVMPKPGARNLFMSCKNASDIAESLVFIPRGGGRARRIGYERVKK